MNKDHELEQMQTRQDLGDANSRIPIRVRGLKRDPDYRGPREPMPSLVSGWRRRKALERRSKIEAISLSYWERRGVCVISALELAKAPDGKDDAIPQFHLSMSNRERCTDEEVAQTLACFGMIGAEEDNHHPGIARHFWMPLDPARRVDCECKTNERVIVEPDGYRYSEKIGTCAGCDLELASGKPCERHGRGDEQHASIASDLGKPPCKHKSVGGCPVCDRQVCLDCRAAVTPARDEEKSIARSCIECDPADEYRMGWWPISGSCSVVVNEWGFDQVCGKKPATDGRCAKHKEP